MSKVENLGVHGVKGGPGRPKGSRNKLTVTMEAIDLKGGVDSNEFRALCTVMLTHEDEQLAIEAMRLIRHAHRVAPVQGAAK